MAADCARVLSRGRVPPSGHRSPNCERKHAARYEEHQGKQAADEAVEVAQVVLADALASPGAAQKQ